MRQSIGSKAGGRSQLFESFEIFEFARSTCRPVCKLHRHKIEKESGIHVMASQRAINTLLSVFDLKIIDGSNLEELAAARIVFVFDKHKNLREFSIVDSKMPHELQEKLRAWLEKNVDPGKILDAVKSDPVTVCTDRETFEVILH